MKKISVKIVHLSLILLPFLGITNAKAQIMPDDWRLNLATHAFTISSTCCPDVYIQPCQSNPASGNINYEVHIDIPVMQPVCQLTDFKISGINYAAVGSVYSDNDPAMDGNTFWPAAGSGSFPWNSIALTGTARANKSLVFIVNLPVNYTGTMTFTSVSCEGEQCSYAIPVAPSQVSEKIEMATVPFEDSLFAMKVRIKPEGTSDMVKLRYVSVSTVCCGDAATGSTNPDQPDIFAVTGGANLVAPSAAHNFQFRSASMGKTSAHFELLQPLSLVNFPQDIFLHLVTTHKADSLYMAFFDENGYLINTTILDNLTQHEIVAVSAPNELMGEASLSPNPASDQATLQFQVEQSQRIQVEVLGLTGNLIWRKDAGFCAKGAQQSLAIPTSTFSEGTYLLRIQSEKGKSLVKRLIVAH